MSAILESDNKCKSRIRQRVLLWNQTTSVIWSQTMSVTLESHNECKSGIRE